MGNSSGLGFGGVGDADDDVQDDDDDADDVATTLPAGHRGTHTPTLWILSPCDAFDMHEQQRQRQATKVLYLNFLNRIFEYAKTLSKNINNDHSNYQAGWLARFLASLQRRDQNTEGLERAITIKQRILGNKGGEMWGKQGEMGAKPQKRGILVRTCGRLLVTFDPIMQLMTVVVTGCHTGK